MFSSFGQKLEHGFRSLLPLLTSFLFVVAESFAWPLPYASVIAPSLGFSAIYYWAVHRPDLLRPSSVFFLGLLHDAIAGLPLGFSSFLFLVFYQLIISQRRFFVGHAFLVLWLVFVLAEVISLLFSWCVFSLYRSELVPFSPLLVQSFVTICFFPVLAFALIRLQRAFLGKE